MLQKVAFTMYPVKDMARARSFYEGALGLEVSSKSTSGMWTEYDLPGGGCLALFKTSDIQPSSAAGGSIAFEVDDLDGLLGSLEEKGIEIKARLIQSPVCRMSVVVDSEGNSLLIHQLKKK